MKLKKLIVQGFKSFKDKTTINFDQGITGIVGPNGCGKSNIVDALFWVMGAQSAKHLRGNTMKDVIFSGSEKYNPGAWAEVSLVLENDTGKHIHIGSKVCNPSEIQLTRKLYRNGESDYRINGEPARLKDIQEVFMDTGAGAKSYSIIAQGEINRLVQAKPEERRVMIEEVAGITKFKQKKKESLRKIEQTQSNLERLNDLQIEIDKNLKALQKQAEKASRARTLKEKIKRHDLIVNSHKVFEHMKLLKEGGELIAESEVALTKDRAQKAELEQSLELERKQKSEESKALDKLQQVYNESSKDLAASEERFNSLCTSLTGKEENLDKENKNLVEIEEDIKNREKVLSEIMSELEAFKSKSFNVEELEALEIRVKELEQTYSDKKGDLSQLEGKLKEVESSKDSLDKNIFQNESKKLEYSNNLEDISKEIEELEEEYSSYTSEISTLGKDVFSLEESLTLSSNEVSKKTTAKIDLAASLAEKKQELEQLQNSLIRKNSRLESLQEIKKALEGTKAGTGLFLESNTENFDVLGNLIVSKPEATKAVEVLIRDIADKIVSKEGVQTGGMENLLSWIKDNQDKSIEFIAASESQKQQDEIKERLKVRLNKNVSSLIELVQLEKGYESTLSTLLEGYYIIDDLVADDFLLLTDISGFKGLCSLDGDTAITHKSGSYILSASMAASANTGMGVVERNNLINELINETQELNTQLPQLEQEVLESQNTHNELVESLELERNNLSEVKSQLAGKRSLLESKEKAYKMGSSRLDILKNRKSEISKLRLNILEEEEGIAKEFKAFDEELAKLSTTLESKKLDLESSEENLQKLRLELKEKNVEINSAQGRLDSLNKQSRDAEVQLSRYSERKNRSQELIVEFKAQIEKLEEDLAELEKTNKISAIEIESHESELKAKKSVVEALSKQMIERENTVRKLSKEISSNEKLINEKTIKMQHALVEEEQVSKDIFERHQIDLRDSIGVELEFTEEDYKVLNNIDSIYQMESDQGVITIDKVEYNFVRKYGQELKESTYKLRNYKNALNNLGEINWQAVEDYERQKLRSDFLKAQEQELRQSLHDLHQAIDHIDEKSKDRFKFAFEEVNSRFKKVFPIIFGGGSASLKIIGDINDTECGVDIMAQPPGKKIQNNNSMSGGEKALTAVSLIFSIFLVKPSPFCLLDEVDAPLDDANVGRFNDLLREMSSESQFILITHNKKTMELNDTLYGVTMQEPGVSKAVSVQLQ